LEKAPVKSAYLYRVGTANTMEARTLEIRLHSNILSIELPVD
jgi:hypothetical protein